MTGDGLDCPSEYEPQSLHSRGGVVEDQERLGRFVYHKEQVDDATGELKPGAFPMAEFIEAERRGASVIRVDRSNRDELHQQGGQFAAPGRDRWVRGLGVSAAMRVRQVLDGSRRRVFCVIDDGEPSFETHALISRSEAYTDGGFTERRLKSMLKPFRESLRELFSPVTTIEEIYSHSRE